MGSARARFVRQWYARKKAGPLVQDTGGAQDDNVYYEFEFDIEMPAALNESKPPAVPEGNDDRS